MCSAPGEWGFAEVQIALQVAALQIQVATQDNEIPIAATLPKSKDLRYLQDRLCAPGNS